MPKTKTKTKKEVAKKTAAKKAVKRVSATKPKISKKIVKKKVNKVVGPARGRSASGGKKKAVKKTATKKKATKKTTTKKRAIKKEIVSKSSLNKNEEKMSSGVFSGEFKKTERRIFSPDVFGSPEVGSSYFNTVRRQIEIQSLVRKNKEGQRILGADKVNHLAKDNEVLKTKKSNRSREQIIAVKKDQEVDIDFDFNVFSNSPHIVDLRDRNTHEIKEIISGKPEKYTDPVQYSQIKIKTKIKKVRPKKEGVVKQNFIDEDVLWEDKRKEEKIGFWKTLIMPIYTIFKWAEDFFIDLSSLTRGKLPRVLRFSLPEKWDKSLVAFVVLCFMLVLPFESVFLYSASDKKGLVLGEATSAIEDLKMGSESILGRDLIKANYYFLESLGNFEKASQELGEINSFIVKLLEQTSLDGGRVSTGKNLISFGESVSRSAVYLNAALVSLMDQRDSGEVSSLIVNNNEIEGVNLPPDILSKIAFVKGNILSASNELKLANENLSNINLDVLEQSDIEKILMVKRVLPTLILSLDNFHELLESWEIILGKDNFKRYLVVFQNNYEIRATGGFIGSFALIDIDNGVIENVEIPGGGSYDLQGGLIKRISAPEPFYLVSPLWQFHDTNWWPDFPTSAQKLMQFYEFSGGRTVDGVIALTPQMIIDLLKITGPIEMAEYDEVVTAENFMWVTQYNVELEYDKEENKPKKFLSDLCVKLLGRLTKESSLVENEGVMMGFVGIMNSAIKKKDLQLYFSDDRVQNMVEKYSLDGGIKKSSGDYLMIVNSNVGGGKSDSAIEQTIDLESKIGRDGYIFNKLTIRRKHNGNKDDYFQRVRNVNWLRVYVPEGSELISARGFEKPDGINFRKPEGELEIDKDVARLEGGYKLDSETGTRTYNQFGKTVFANWSMIDLGEEAVIEVEYKLPFGLLKKEPEIKDKDLLDKLLSSFMDDNNSEEPYRDLRGYTLLVQKQAGVNSRFNYRLVKPTNWETVWVKSPGDNTPDTLTEDKFFGKIFEIK